MGEGILLAGKALFAAAGLAAALRLGAMARGPEGLRQHAWAAGMILLGGAGLLSYAISASVPGSLGPTLAVLGDVAERAALALLCLFVWKVFRPDDRWAGALAVLGIGLLAATGVWWLRTEPFPHSGPGGAASQATQAAFALPFVWSALEAGLLFSRSRRQVRVGLSEPAVAHRFLLWSAACATFATICGLSIVVALPGAPAPALDAARGLLYATISGVVWLGFFAPDAYQRRVARSPWFGAPSAESGSG